MSNIKEFISTKTAAKEMDLSVRTIQKLITEGKIPALKMAGSHIYLISRKTWEEWKARNVIAA